MDTDFHSCHDTWEEGVKEMGLRNVRDRDWKSLATEKMKERLLLL